MINLPLEACFYFFPNWVGGLPGGDAPETETGCRGGVSALRHRRDPRAAVPRARQERGRVLAS